jgi:hypothetical protein
MGYQVQVSNTSAPIRFLMVLSSDHITGATGKTVTVTIAKNNGAFAVPAGSITEVGNGIYQIAANAVDANTLGPLFLHATASGCDPTDDQFDVVQYNPTAFSPSTAPVGPGAISALEIINDAFELIEVKAQGETLLPEDTAGALRRLNQVVSQWSLQSLTIPYTSRQTFPLVPGQGGPSNPYTIGIGGDFNTTRPVKITSVSLLDTSTADEFEVQRTLYTQAAYFAIVMKELQSVYFNGLYYEPTYGSGWGSIYLYPVPSVANDLVLYSPAALSSFANLSALYDLPPGAPEALTYDLARRLARPYGRPWPADLAKDAADFLAIYKRGNTVMADLSLDPALTGNVRGAYNILSDSGS